MHIFELKIFALTSILSPRKMLFYKPEVLKKRAQESTFSVPRPYIEPEDQWSCKRSPDILA